MSIDKILKKLYNDKNLTPANAIRVPDPIATVSPALNYALNGGIRSGGFYCFSGPESSGKSFLALSCVAQLLRKNPEGVVFWFDVEKSFSEHFAKVLLTPDEYERCVIKRCDFGSDIFDYFENTILGLIDEGLNVVGCVVDSLQAIIPPKELNAKSTDDHLMGDLSSYLPKAMRKILKGSRARLNNEYQGVPWIFISQVRLNFDPTAVMRGEKYSSTGGKAFDHFIDVKLLLEPIKSKKSRVVDDSQMNMNDTAIQIGHHVRAKVTKNKYGSPDRVVEFTLLYDYGIVNQHEEVFILASSLNLIKRDGHSYLFKDQKIAVGEAATINAIKENKELYQQIEKSIQEESINEYSAT